VTREDYEIHKRNAARVGVNYWRYFTAPSEVRVYLVQLPKRAMLSEASLDSKHHRSK
jgi:hypothetical protein